MPRFLTLLFVLSISLACQDQESRYSARDRSQKTDPQTSRDTEAAGAAESETREPMGSPESKDSQDTPAAPASPADSSSEIPSGCNGASTVTANDFLLYRGETLPAAENNVVTLGQGWRADEVWDNGRLQLETLGSGTMLSFSNEGIYHGFKFTPPSVNGVRRNFTLTGADVYVELRRPNPTAALPTFGLRVIKPNEFEGNGGAPTTTWMMDKPSNGSRFLTAKNECALIQMSIPQAFLDEKAVGNRLIWEMQSNWNIPDKIIIRKIVLKGFQLMP